MPSEYQQWIYGTFQNTRLPSIQTTKSKDPVTKPQLQLTIPWSSSDREKQIDTYTETTRMVQEAPEHRMVPIIHMSTSMIQVTAFSSYHLP